MGTHHPDDSWARCRHLGGRWPSSQRSIRVGDQSRRLCVTHSAARGSSTVEFAGVGALLTLCALGVLQVGTASHISAIMTDSAIAGAAYAALADSSDRAGAARARELASRALPPELVREVTAHRTEESGIPVATVTIRYRVPMLGLWLPTIDASVSGRALREVP